MTDKERLEELETKYSTLTVSSEKNSTEYTEVDVEDLVFLIQNGFKQAERVEELEEEVERYQSGRNVAVITKMKMDVTQERNEKLEKQVQKLENRIADDEHFVAEILEQNKRYRETIEEAIEYANSPKILTSPAGIKKILSKALEESK